MDALLEWLTPLSIIVGFILSAIAWRISEATKDTRQEERLKAVAHSNERLATNIEKLATSVDGLRQEHAHVRERLALTEQESVHTRERVIAIEAQLKNEQRVRT